MGRRASSGLNAAAIMGIAAAVLVFVVGGFIALKKMPFFSKKGGFSGPPLPVEETFTNANGMRRNEYTVEGRVFRIESRDSGVGVCLMVASREGEEQPVFVKVPEDIATINLERDVTYAFKIRVEEGGVNVAQAIKKP